MIVTKPDALVLDMDGTLWDAVDTYTLCWNKAFEEVGVSTVLRREELLKLMGTPIDEIMRVITPGMTSEDREKFVARVNCEKGELQIFAKFAEIEEWISGSISFGDTYLQKGENMRLLQQRFQLKSPVYIGDTDGDGVQARLAGWPFVFVRYGFGSTDRFDLAFDSFSELTDYFMNLS